VQGDGNQCHARALSHPLQPGQVPYSITFSHLGTAPDTAVNADSGPVFALRIRGEFRIRNQ
jgi:hypothetical protein